MKDEKVWEGSPRYVFKVTLLEKGSYYDAGMGSSSLFGLYVILVCVILYLVESFLKIELGIRVYAFTIVVSAFCYEVYQWFRLKEYVYVLKSDEIQIFKNIRELKTTIQLDEISNIYSLDETRKLESVMISYQTEESAKTLKQSLSNLKKEEEVVNLINKQRKIFSKSKDKS